MLGLLVSMYLWGGDGECFCGGGDGLCGGCFDSFGKNFRMLDLVCVGLVLLRLFSLLWEGVGDRDEREERFEDLLLEVMLGFFCCVGVVGCEVEKWRVEWEKGIEYDVSV